MTYEERMFYITRNLVSYKEYNNDVLKASRVLRKYSKTKSINECQEDLEKRIDIYKAGIEFVQIHKDEYWKSKERTTRVLAEAENEFVGKYPEIAEDLLRYMLLEIFNWYHER